MIKIYQGDITQEEVDVIVNAANTQLKGGGGVDGAIHRAAGPSLLQQCKMIGHCATGNAVLTGGGQLKAHHVIHTVGPVWSGGNKNEPDLLKSCYENSFKLASEHQFKSIAFPAISTGVYRFPKPEACQIALSVGRNFENQFEVIHYVCFSEEDTSLYLSTWETMRVQS